jgi:thiol-disulfide isomerase/thioredoxin
MRLGLCFLSRRVRVESCGEVVLMLGHFLSLQQKVSARELDDILANERSSPMVVDFYATWCGPCILLAQELEQVLSQPASLINRLS